MDDAQLENVVVLDAHVGAIVWRALGYLEEVGEELVVQRVLGDAVEAVLHRVGEHRLALRRSFARRVGVGASRGGSCGCGGRHGCCGLMARLVH